MLLTLGINHKTAPINIREKLAFSPENIPLALPLLAKQASLEEVALLSTCNRTEVYCSAPTVDHVNAVLSWWRSYHQTSFDLNPYMYVLSDYQAVKHMMRVASGLDSMLIGEPQILGQLKSAYQMAQAVGIIGKKLSRLFQVSFSVAKRIRANTDISKHPVSVAYAAVRLAKQIFTDLSKATVTLIGAGENIELLLTHLVSLDVKRIHIVNRTLNNAEQLAQRYQAKAFPLQDLAQAISTADIVISAIDIQEPIVTLNTIEKAFTGNKRRPILMIDLGVPRNIAPALASHDDVYLYSIDDLQGIVTENLKTRERSAIEAEVMIDDAASTFMDWVSADQKLKIVSQLRHQVEGIKDEMLTHALKEIDNGKDPKEVVTHFAHRLTQKLIHQPTMGIRKVGKEDKAKFAVVKELFSIE